MAQLVLFLLEAEHQEVALLVALLVAQARKEVHLPVQVEQVLEVQVVVLAAAQEAVQAAVPSAEPEAMIPLPLLLGQQQAGGRAELFHAKGHELLSPCTHCNFQSPSCQHPHI